MVSENSWLTEKVEGKGKALNVLKKAENHKRKKVQKSRPGSHGKPPVEALETEIHPRLGKDGPLVMMYGQGPRKDVQNVLVPLSVDIVAKLDKYTTGSRAQVVALLAAHALDRLEEHGECIIARGIK